ncbi:MAG: hypothetical protein D6718_05395 [Acidobacteria bacterium]|nr:MAG: hypothetical protein D6718_05395 [Acidobacteriota bacterium]
MRRAALVLPGRGSYTEASLGSLPGEHPLVARAEKLRAERGLPPLLELDRAERFRPSVHLAPRNASALIYVASMLDVERAFASHRVVCVGGNSLGWYTALAAAGSLSFEEGFRLVQEMALIQEEFGVGGQIVYPVVGEDWRPDPVAQGRVRRALEAAGGEAFLSIRLGGYAVLGGTRRGLERAAAELPPAERRGRRYPFALARHHAYHTPLLARVAEAARERLSGLAFRPPDVTLVDGRGCRHTPWSGDPAGLREYTLGAQIVETYDLTCSVRVMLREYAPDAVVLPGPGNTLGGVVGQIMIEEGYRGLSSKSDFDAAQRGTAPPVVSMGRAEPPERQGGDPARAG